MNYFDDDTAWEAFRREAESWLRHALPPLAALQGTGR